MKHNSISHPFLPHSSTPVDVGVNFMVYDLHVIFGLLFTQKKTASRLKQNEIFWLKFLSNIQNFIGE